MQKKDKEKDPAAWWQPSVILFYRLSGWVVGPVVLALLLGKWIDKRYDSEPWGLLICVGVAFVGSCVGIVKEANKAMDQINKD